MTRSLESFLCLSHVFPLLDEHAPNLKWLRGGTRKIHQLDHGGSMLVHMQQCLTMPDQANFLESQVSKILMLLSWCTWNLPTAHFSLLHGGFWGLKRVIPVNGAMEKRRHISI